MTSVALAPCYVFGIVPATDVGSRPIAGAQPSGGSGITAIRVVSRGALAAVVGSAPVDRPIGRAADLRTHDAVLASLVADEVPVLPLRFGAVLADEQAVLDELLEPHHDEFVRALEQLRGRLQFVVRARYEQDTILREVLADHPEIARLRQHPDQADWNQQIRLGELVVAALERRRPGDAETVLAALTPLAVAVRRQEVSAADEVLHLAVLVDRSSRNEFERAVEECGRSFAGRIRFRLVGPVAPYDFVPEG
jgi:hypothetical protein